MTETPSQFAGDRLAKVIARAGLCSRRDAEQWIKEGRVAVNGTVIRTPAFNVTARDQVEVDGAPLVSRSGTRVWAYHKPAGLVVTEKDPEGRPTIFETLASQGLPRVLSIGRLDINTEGLLLLTNDGGLKRVLELPATGWLRRYRVRAFGAITQPQLDALAGGLEVDGVKYGPIEAVLEREQGSNVWLVVGLREGKNREVKNVLEALGLKVNRLIRVSFGPFQLGDLPIGGVEIVRARVLREQLGKRLADEAGVDFDSDMPEPAATTRARRAADPNLRAAAPGKREPWQRRAPGTSSQSGARQGRSAPTKDRPMAPDRPGSRFPRRPAAARDAREPEAARRVLNADGSTGEFTPKARRRDGDASGPGAFTAGRGKGASTDDRRPRDRDHRRGPARATDRPKRAYAARPGEGAERPKRPYVARSADARPDRPKRDFADRPKRPYAPRSPDAPDRPKRTYKAGADAGARPDRPKRSFGDRAPRSASGPRPPSRGPRGAGDKPFAKRPRGSGPSGDRPRRPRPPKE